VWRNHPRGEDGRAAYDAATSDSVAQGSVGAGTGARVGGLKGGIGSASVVLRSGVTVGAVVAVNAVGSAVDPHTALPYAAGLGLAGELAHIGVADPGQVAEARARGEALPDKLAAVPAMATTIGVIATDATLSKAQCQKLAGIGHDGFARAIKPVHTAFDGDTLFAMATGEREVVEGPDLLELMEAGADCVARAIVHGVLAATSVDRTADGGIAMRSWSEAFSSALRT
jgi:putative pantetheine hydrolase